MCYTLFCYNALMLNNVFQLKWKEMKYNGINQIIESFIVSEENVQ